MEFNNQFPEWKNEGTSPPEELKTNGFEGGDKPPAAWLNWLCSLVGKCISELQTKLTAHNNNKENPHKVTASQVGLDKVNNTSDAEKSVKFASESASSRKVQYPMSIRFKGGSTEGTDLWTYDGSTSRSVNITAKKIGAAEEIHEHSLDAIDETTEKKLTRLIPAISTDGEAYTATIDGVTELYNGMEITIIPNMTSTKNAITLDVNGLGARNVRMSIGGYNFGNSGTIAALAGWLGADCPVTLQYKAKFDNWQTVIPRPSVTGLYGTVKIEQGGTGATTVEGALENLGLTNKGDMAIVSYVGTGKSGASYPCSVTFDFVPKVLVLLARYVPKTSDLYSRRTISLVNNSCNSDDDGNVTILCDKLSTDYESYHGFWIRCNSSYIDKAYAKKSDDGKTIYWYIAESDMDNIQANEAGQTYYILGIG